MKEFKPRSGIDARQRGQSLHVYKVSRGQTFASFQRSTNSTPIMSVDDPINTNERFSALSDFVMPKQVYVQNPFVISMSVENSDNKGPASS